jgi:hypothetical protein
MESAEKEKYDITREMPKPDRYLKLNLTPDERIVSVKVTTSKNIPIKYNFVIYNVKTGISS